MSHLLVRIYFTEEEERIFLKLLLELKKRGVGGATLLKGIAGYGKRGLHDAGVEVFSYSLPVVLEIVEEEEKIKEVLEGLKNLLQGRLITTEKAELC